MQVGDPGHQGNAARQGTEAELLCALAYLSTLAHRGHQLGQQPSDVSILLIASDGERRGGQAVDDRAGTTSGPFRGTREQRPVTVEERHWKRQRGYVSGAEPHDQTASR